MVVPPVMEPPKSPMVTAPTLLVELRSISKTAPTPLMEMLPKPKPPSLQCDNVPAVMVIPPVKSFRELAKLRSPVPDLTNAVLPDIFPS